ncbi:MAG: ATP-binding cassette domain-containing protein [Pseudonocardia sp.]|nr:ATP-binding cassette domain-containing protein [Pseudonocardia sp.]
MGLIVSYVPPAPLLTNWEKAVFRAQGDNEVLQVTGLVKRYPKSPVNAVDGLEFSVRRGEVFGLLGPNGAGKTTTVGVLTTRVLPTAGTARIGGLDVVRDAVAVRKQIGVVPQRVNLDRALSPRNNLIFHAAYHGVPRAERAACADALLDRMGLAEKAKTHIDTFSGGQAQRLMIARALMHRPEVLFLDEPSGGLDPQARLFVHERVWELRDEGVTIVLTTHDMDEAAKLSDRVGIIDHGRMRALDTPARLIRTLSEGATVDAVVRLGWAPIEPVVEILDSLPGVARVEVPQRTKSAQPSLTRSGGAGAPHISVMSEADPTHRLRIYTTQEPTTLLGPVVSALSAHGATVSDLAVGKPTLEDVFIHLTGRDLR